ncbi:nascent polypeptide-associated complex protein [Halorientalis pallida]|uniref:Nascent polypeptide-associated complex protein n=1 Tax=Halorientalis pallida TaxID=2479928 RepID=A0A498KX31_9EURY|nr:nascent polypeptide-associated complex protein [Halorientalis pallida]RXK48453.1 nascent polypeptide-associated complex protein [Halorientalis pallida]
MFGGGGFDPQKMQQMMDQFGIDIDELDAEEVIIRTADEELVFTDAEVQRMDAQGQETYQVIGTPETREAGEASAVESGDGDSGGNGGIPDADVEIVANRAGVSEDDAREALEEEDGNLAAAVERLE